MIDTSKYEGHTEGPWYAEEEEREGSEVWTMYGSDHWVVMESDGCLRIDWKKEDALLAADAPLLLDAYKEKCEEVKRLRELFSIDEGSRDEGYCVTMRLEGCEYIGTLRLYKDEEGKVIE